VRLACFARRAMQRVRVCDMDVVVPDLHDARLPQLPHCPGDRLPVGAYQAGELLVGVTGGAPSEPPFVSNDAVLSRVTNGTRTRDVRGHNPFAHKKRTRGYRVRFL
jgi:hypothetical protein